MRAVQGIIAMLFAAIIFSTAVSAAPGYVALGDSISAAGGLYEDRGGCGRSSLTYPYMVADAIGLPLTHLACGGAKVDEGLYGSQGTIPPQIDAAFEGGVPDVMTVTIGANDTRWTHFLAQCFYWRCGYGVDTARSALYMADLKIELNIFLAKVYERSNGNPPEIYMTGYYNPFPTKECESIPELTSKELSWMNKQVSHLNRTIRATASKYSFVTYVPVDFKGHDICSSQPWVQGIDEKGPFHPNAKGQRAIAVDVLKKYKQSTDDSSSRSLRESILKLRDL